MKVIMDTHLHTIASDHAYSTITECMEAAYLKGLRLIAFTEHCPKLLGAPTMIYFQNGKVIPKNYKGVEVLWGAELNILDFDGNVDLPQGLIKTLGVVIASLHDIVIKPGAQEENTIALISAMKNPYIDVIGHPGDPSYPIDIPKIVKAAKETGTVLEINNSLLKPNWSPRSGGEAIVEAIVREAVKQGVYLIINSDAHYHEAIGDLCYAIQLVEKVGVPDELLLNSSIELFHSVISKKPHKNKPDLKWA
ncbi:phosphatase [Oscillospiraceae bacterium PP1C4]